MEMAMENGDERYGRMEMIIKKKGDHKGGRR
jgi:hypothetical protein